MGHLLTEIRKTPILWLLVAVPVVLVAERVRPGAHTLLFGLSVVAIVPLAALLSRATEAVAARTGDNVGGLLNATLGNLTELVIALAALRAGQYDLVKASVAGAIVTNALFMLGGAMLLGGLRRHVQTFNVAAARLQAMLLFAATVALLVPSLITAADRIPQGPALQTLSGALAVLLMLAYGLGLVFSLGTHRAELAALSAEGGHEEPWPMMLGIGVLAVVTLLVALVSEIFVASVEVAGATLGMTPAFVGFVVVALVGAAAEMTTAFSAALRDRLDLAIGIALGSAVQIALFVAPLLVLLSYVIGPTPMGLQFWPGAVVMMMITALTARFLTSGGRSAWFVGVMLLLIYLIFAVTLYVIPPLS